MARQRVATRRRARSPRPDLRDTIHLSILAMKLAEDTMTAAVLALRQQNADQDESIAHVLQRAGIDRLSAQREALEALLAVQP